MSRCITADAGPLIGLARAGLLEILPKLYPAVEVPPAVMDELRIVEDRPGSRALREAHEAGWLLTVALKSPARGTPLLQMVDRGEAEAILLADERGSRFLLLDERRGRALARKRGVAVVGTGGVLVVAKEEGLVSRVGEALDKLAAAGYRLSPKLRTQILGFAGE